MSFLSQLSSPEILRPLGLALLHFLWQGAAFAAVAYSAMALFRRASVRYVVAVAMLVLMVVAPVATFFVLHQQDSAEPGPAAAANPAIVNFPQQIVAAVVPDVSRARAVVDEHRDALLLFVEFWLAGVILLSLRPAGGLLLVRRMWRQPSSPVSNALRERFLVLQRRLGLDVVVRYCESLHLEAPAVAGWFRPVVFLPVRLLTGLSESQLDAVIAHELAHIKRFDAFVNLFQSGVETLLFYHPAVWWLSRRIRIEREHCCDDAAIAVCGDAVDYARALATIAELQAVPAFAMAANRGPLAARVARVLGLKTNSGEMRNAGIAMSALCLCTALVVGNALVGAVRTATAAQTPVITPAPAATAATRSARPQPHAIVITTTAPMPAPVVTPVPMAAPSLAWMPEAAQGEKQSSASSYIEEIKAAGLKDISVDELINLKIQGVTGDYIRGMLALGFKPDAGEIVALKIQGVTPEYIRDLRATGLTVDPDQILAMKVQGITPEYIQKIRQSGLAADADDIIAMKVQNVTPEYAAELRKTGLKINNEDVLAMKVQGVTPEYIKSIQDLGLHPDGDNLLAMKVQGITPDYVRAIRATGINADTDSLIGMKVQGVTADYIKMLQAEGFKVDADDVISAKVQGITPEFLEKVKSHGFKNLSMDQLIGLKHAGVLD